MAPVSAMAAMISGELGITGDLTDFQASDFNPGGSITITSGSSFVQRAEGTFADVGIAAPEAVTFTSPLLFNTTPQLFFTIGTANTSFTITEFLTFDDTPSNVGFTAFGYFLMDGFEQTDGFVSFSTEVGENNEDLVARATFSVNAQVPLPAGVLLMGTALAGFGVMRRKAKKAAA